MKRDDFRHSGEISTETETPSRKISISPFFKDSVSDIKLSQGGDPSAYSSSEYSHYIAVPPLDTERQEQGKESTRRFCGGLGVSIVERIKAEDVAIRASHLLRLPKIELFTSKMVAGSRFELLIYGL